MSDPLTEPTPIEESALPDAALRPEPAAAQTRRGRVREAIVAHARLLEADSTTWFAAIVSAIVLTVSRYHASTGEYAQLWGRFSAKGGLYAVMADSIGLHRLAGWLTIATGPTAEYLYWFLASVVLFAVIPLAAAAVTPGVRIAELGVGAGDWRYGLKATALLYTVMLPFVVGASSNSEFTSQYPMCSGAASTWRALLVFELCYASYFIGWEFIYRGLLCNGLYPRIKAAAILLPALPFAVMHAGKPEAESYGAILAAIALGVMAVRARSFWYGAVLHASVAATMDALALTHTHRWPTHW